jgi:two-component system, NtrC family, response regulator
MAKILIIDDDKELCTILSVQIGSLGHETRVAHMLRDGYDLSRREAFDIVFLDVRLPDGNGLDILTGIRDRENAPEVIIMTGTGDSDGAEMAINNGAWDYIQKPYSLKQMTLPLIRALDYREARSSSRRSTVLNLEGIIGSSRQIQKSIHVLAQTADSDANVLITGETGTGKEVFALAVHRNSKRANGEFVVVDCGAMTETLVESLLFGHEKGAFTGAERKRTGLLKTADGGTLFLDEVGELPLSIQRSLLRALQERRFRPVGGDREIESHFRLVAATNRELDDMVQEGRFREDLLHRLRSVTLHLPPLRERDGDLRELATYFVGRICERNEIGPKGISADFMEVLRAYSWPGNVRELQHVLERTVIQSKEVPVLYPEHLPVEMRAKIVSRMFHRQEAASPQNPTAPEEPFPTMIEYEKQSRGQYLTELIDHARGDYRTACRLSGISKSKLYQLLKTYGKTLK